MFFVDFFLYLGRFGLLVLVSPYIKCVVPGVVFVDISLPTPFNPVEPAVLPSWVFGSELSVTVISIFLFLLCVFRALLVIVVTCPPRPSCFFVPGFREGVRGVGAGVPAGRIVVGVFLSVSFFGGVVSKWWLVGTANAVCIVGSLGCFLWVSGKWAVTLGIPYIVVPVVSLLSVARGRATTLVVGGRLCVVIPFVVGGVDDVF